MVRTTTSPIRRIAPLWRMAGGSLAEGHDAHQHGAARGGRGHEAKLNQPARRISLRSASARLNFTRTCDHASALQRVYSITRRTRLIRRQGCQRRASCIVHFLAPVAARAFSRAVA
jgi:hypothetical protein